MYTGGIFQSGGGTHPKQTSYPMLEGIKTKLFRLLGQIGRKKMGDFQLICRTTHFTVYNCFIDISKSGNSG
jgi:hypothetical protein